MIAANDLVHKPDARLRCSSDRLFCFSRTKLLVISTALVRTVFMRITSFRKESETNDYVY